MLLGFMTLSWMNQPTPPARSAVHSPADAVALAAADVSRLPTSAAREARYLWLGNATSKEKQELWMVLSVWCNLLSREPDLVRPVVIGADGKAVDGLALPATGWADATLFRLFLVDYRWPATVWDQLGEADPYFHVTVEGSAPTEFETVIEKRKEIWVGGVWRVEDGGDGKNYPAGTYDREFKVSRSKKSATLRQRALAPWVGGTQLLSLIGSTGSQTPVLRADWFLWEVGVQADRKVGYYGLMEVKNRADFQKLVGFDQKLSEAFTRELLAAVANSGVAQQPRRIARFEKIGGAYWSTFDNKQSVDKANPLRVLNGGFTHDAEEVFSHGSNGLWKVGLFAANGDRQDSAPDFVGFDKTSHNNDGRIHIGLSCFRCHQQNAKSDGLNEIKDWSRTLFKPPLALTSPDYDQLKKLRQHYLRRLEPFMSADRARHADAVRECSGLGPADFGAALSQVWSRYDDSITLERAAAELGVTPQRWRTAVDAYMKMAGQTDTVLGMYARPADEQHALPLTTWHESYAQAQVILRSINP